MPNKLVVKQSTGIDIKQINSKEELEKLVEEMLEKIENNLIDYEINLIKLL